MSEREQELQQAIESMAEDLHAERKLKKSQVKIMSAALNLFSTKGFDNSSTVDIAKEAGVSEVTLFRNFKTKHNLLYQVIAPLIIKMTSPIILEGVKQGLDGEEDSRIVLKRVLMDRMELLHRNEKGLKILLREAMTHEEILQAILKHVTNPAKEEVMAFIRSKKEQGEFRDVDEQVTVDFLFNLLLGYVMSKHMLNIPTENTEEEQLEAMIDFVLRGLQAQPPTVDE